MGGLDDSAPDPNGLTLPLAGQMPGSLELPTRYESRAVLGRGGMGEIVLARDTQLGRDVALKAGHIDNHEDARRFVREVHLQGQLEHPGIVPVYDAGTLPDGSPFFTMKRVRGSTLDEILGLLARHDPFADSKFTRPRLLAIFVTIAQSVHYAHTRGVVHRDLKPANVMVGDFGEIYVLDWGIAKLSSPTAEPISTRSSSPPESVHLPQAESLPTQHGELLGTLGYMAPEQLTDASTVDHRADIYSLGAILFEILTLERLHPQPRAVDVVESTLADAAPRIRDTFRKRDLAPELEETCLTATATQPDDRFDSVDDIIAAVQSFLDGDRDVEARAKMAEDEAQRALAAMERDERAIALKHAGRTLALDPSNPIAQEVIVRLMVETPASETVPSEVERAVERDAVKLYRKGGMAGAFLFSPWLILIVALQFGKVEKPLVLLLWSASVLFAAGLLIANGRARRRSASLFFTTATVCIVSPSIATRLVGPFAIVPGIVTLTVLVFVLLGKREWHAATIAMGALGLVAPVLFEETGILPKTTTFDSVSMRISSDVVHLSPSASLGALTASMVVVYLVVCAAASYFQRVLFANARRAAMQSWKLSSLVPGDQRILPESPPSSASISSHLGRRRRRK